MRQQLKLALTKLPGREALVLQLYCVEELNVYEVGGYSGGHHRTCVANQEGGH